MLRSKLKTYSEESSSLTFELLRMLPVEKKTRISVSRGSIRGTQLRCSDDCREGNSNVDEDFPDLETCPFYT